MLSTQYASIGGYESLKCSSKTKYTEHTNADALGAMNHEPQLFKGVNAAMERALYFTGMMLKAKILFIQSFLLAFIHPSVY